MKIYKYFRLFIPLRWSRQLENFFILAQGYGQYKSIKLQRPVTKEGDKIPWYTYPAIEYLNNLDFKDKTVFEYGMGYSSHYWSTRASAVFSVEHDKIWFEEMNVHQLPNLKTKFAETKESYVKHLLESPMADIIIIDGIHREECVDVIVQTKHFNPGCIIIFDNAEWYPETCQKLRDELDFIEVDFNGFGPMNEITWTTSIFFHREFRMKSIGKQPKISQAGVDITGKVQGFSPLA